MRYLHRTNERRLPAGYDGDVLVWDIDKTYLATRFSSLRGLAAIPIEFAVDKETVPGAAPLLRALRRGPGRESAIVPLYFVSGSPPQLRHVVERRMTLDGVDFDGITFKDQWGLLLAGRPRGILEQVGYKLLALLLYRADMPTGRWLLFGDDVEADALVFSLFGEVCAGLRGQALDTRLRSHRVHPADRAAVRRVADALPPGDDPVERIFIHLEAGTDPASYPAPRVVPTRSYLQTALVLTVMGRLRPAAVGSVAKELRRRGLPELELRVLLEDAVHRLDVPRDVANLALR